MLSILEGGVGCLFFLTVMFIFVVHFLKIISIFHAHHLFDAPEVQVIRLFRFIHNCHLNSNSILLIFLNLTI